MILFIGSSPFPEISEIWRSIIIRSSDRFPSHIVNIKSDSISRLYSVDSDHPVSIVGNPSRVGSRRSGQGGSDEKCQSAYQTRKLLSRLTFLPATPLRGRSSRFRDKVDHRMNPAIGRRRISSWEEPFHGKITARNQARERNTVDLLGLHHDKPGRLPGE